MAAVYAKNIILEINITEIKCEYIFKLLLDLKLTISLRINEKNNIYILDSINCPWESQCSLIVLIGIVADSSISRGTDTPDKSTSFSSNHKKEHQCALIIC